MIWNLKAFKKMIKEAVKGNGLTVGKMEDTFFLEGGFWIMHFKEKVFDKEFKAAVIELAGDLPEAGEVFKVIGSMIQYELPFNEFWKMPAQEQYNTKVHMSNIYVNHKGTLCRVVQDCKNKGCTLVTDMWASCVEENTKDGEENVDTDIAGPLITEDGNLNVMLWESTGSKYMLYTRESTLTSAEMDVLGILRTLDIATAEEKN